jgi:hypothetical protein
LAIADRARLPKPQAVVWRNWRREGKSMALERRLEREAIAASHVKSCLDRQGGSAVFAGLPSPGKLSEYPGIVFC